MQKHDLTPNWNNLHDSLTEMNGMLLEMANQIEDLRIEIDCAIDEIEELPRVDGKYVKDTGGTDENSK